MNQNIYFIIIFAIILIALSQIYKNKADRRKRKNIEIIKLNRSSSSLMFGLLFLTTSIIWFIMLLDSFIKMFSLISDGYVQNIFQLFSLKYIENLRLYFYENNIIKQLYIIVNYQSTLYSSLLMIVTSLCSSCFYFNIWYHNNIIYETGILISGNLIVWNKITDYKWDGVYERRMFNKGDYYDLKIFTEFSIFDLSINYDDKERVNEILNNYI